jgi:hypothetical protein
MDNLGLFWVLSPTEGGWGGGRTCREWHLLFAPLDRKPGRLNFTHKNKGRQKKKGKKTADVRTYFISPGICLGARAAACFFLSRF